MASTQRDLVASDVMFGCMTAEDELSTLWTARAPPYNNTSISTSIGWRQLDCVLPNLARIEFPYSSMRRIDLYTGNPTHSFLLIQFLRAPRIYSKNGEEWRRGTDFTPSNCIGQSYAVCLEYPNPVNLPDTFPKFNTHEDSLSIKIGRPYSSNKIFVPILSPPGVPYQIQFIINKLVQTGRLSGPTLDSRFFSLITPREQHTQASIEAALETDSLEECCYEPIRWLTDQYKKKALPRRHRLAEGFVYTYRVQVTPCRVYFHGPEVNMSNRILRRYPEALENFLRVSFVDEDFGELYAKDVSRRTASSGEEIRSPIYDRIRRTLQFGIDIGNKRFEFLAYSQSQLRSKSVWMFAATPEVTAAGIREWMGDFRSIRSVGNYAARLGQSLSSSWPTLSVNKDDIETIPDVEVTREGIKYVFSDGIGKISSDFAQRVAEKCGFESSTPSAFQIRYGGYKGVVAVDPTSKRVMSLRSSMKKFESNNTELDVLAWSKYLPCFLNRQLIILLSTLGVEDDVFEEKQRDAVKQLDNILTDTLEAQKVFEMAPGDISYILKEMLLCGYKPDAEPFLSMMLRKFRAAMLLQTRTKQKIFVPSGRSMMGCLDETRTLEYGQVFVQISAVGNSSENTLPMLSGSDSDQKKWSIIEQKVFVAKSPCLHPGDVRVLSAVNVPALHHMVDCVVFPQKGKRPHPDECSGSDLDGDNYIVCWDPDLIPPQQIDPMDYTPAQNLLVDHDVRIEEVQEYFASFISNNTVGIISNAHTVFADRENEKAMSEPCIRLAELFSIAIDSPKTGVRVEIPPDLRVKAYPDFMLKPRQAYYKGKGVIGKLFRMLGDDSSKSTTMEMDPYDCQMEVVGFEEHKDAAIAYKLEYDKKLKELMDRYGIRTEAEAISDWIIGESKEQQKEMGDLRLAVKSLRYEVRTWLGRNDDEQVSACYHVTYHKSYWHNNQEQFISFPWCFYDSLLRIKRSNANVDRGTEENMGNP